MMMLADEGLMEAVVKFCHPYAWSRRARHIFIINLPILGPLWLLGAAFVYWLAVCAAIGVFSTSLPYDLQTHVG